MFKLYYPDGNGGYNYVSSFNSQVLAEAQAGIDGKSSYMIEQLDGNSNVIMVMSC